MDEDHGRRVRARGAIDIDLLDLGRTVSRPFRRTDPRKRACDRLAVTLENPVAIEGIDGLIIRLVQRLLVHVEPDERPFFTRRFRGQTLREHRIGDVRNGSCCTGDHGSPCELVPPVLPHPAPPPHRRQINSFCNRQEGELTI